MSGPTLIDSSVWITIARPEGDTTLREQVAGLLERQQAALTAPVWLELYQGVRGRREETHLQHLRQLCPWLDFDPTCWELAAQTARACLRAGVNVPQSDILIHACARRHKVPLLHRDRHFTLIDTALASV